MKYEGIFNGPGNELFVPLVLLYDFILMSKDMFERNCKFKMSGSLGMGPSGRLICTYLNFTRSYSQRLEENTSLEFFEQEK